ncbi:MAG: metallophosphoesterase [Bacteroidota bacterium]
MSTYTIGDIHGGLKALEQLIQKLKLIDGDHLIFMGDYVDGWSESAQVVNFLIDLSNRYDCIFIKGNHDVLCEDWLRSETVNPLWYAHGGKETIESYSGCNQNEKLEHLKFFEQTKLYHIDSENNLFLHAGFTSMHGVDKEHFKANFYYDRTLWEMALVADKSMKRDDLNYPKRTRHYREIYIGHTPTTNFNESLPMNALNIWNVDTGAAFKGKLSAIEIDTKEIYQSEPVFMLYPDELGRNKN